MTGSASGAAMLVLALALSSGDAAAPRARKLEGPAFVIEEIERIEATPGERDEDIETLRRVLAEVRSHPLEIADSPAAHESRLRALLLLARRQLEAGQVDGATEAIDEAVRIARGEPLPRGFGDPVDALVLRRIAAPENAPRGTVSVQCGAPCRVILDERDAGSGAAVITRGVPLGPHRLHVEALAGDGLDDHAFVLSPEQSTHEISLFSAATRQPAAAAQPAAPASPVRESTDLVPDRKLPRWAGIVGIAASSAVLLTGAVLLGFDGRCLDGRAASTGCADLLETGIAGGAFVGVGVAGVVGFSIAFGIAESRLRSRPKRSLGR